MESKNRFTGKVLYSCGLNTIKEAVEQAVKEGANLREADLGRANLEGANLEGAYLERADLTEADLTGADLRDANLRGAYLERSNLTGADLRGANLRGAYLTGANLERASLEKIKQDFYDAISKLKEEIPEFYKFLVDGKINGSTYTGACACLQGTFANIKKIDYTLLPSNPNSERPIERFFLAIRKGDTPDNNQVSAIVKSWTEEFCKENHINLPSRKVVWG